MVVRVDPSILGMLRRLDGDVRKVGLVVAGSAVVSTAAAGAGLIDAPVALSPAWLRGVQWVGLAAVVVGVVGLVIDRPRVARRGPDPTMTSLFSAAILMSTLAFAAWLAPRTDFGGETGSAGATATRGSGLDGRIQSDELPAPPPPTGSVELNEGFGPEGFQLPPPPAEEVRTVRREEVGTTTLGFLSDFGELFGALLLVGLVVAASWAVKKPREEELLEVPDEEEPSTREALLAFEASLAALVEPGVDTREAVALAYQRLLSALGLFGLARARYEAPLEHLRRVARRLDLPVVSMGRLARLFVRSRFGAGPTTEAHRRAAAAALRESLATLRSRAEASAS